MSRLNRFNWPEVSTTDAAKSVAFYTALFGWTDQPVMEGGYHILQAGGKDAAGLYELMPDQTARGVRPRWLNYVEVANTDASAAKAKSLGGTVLNEPFDVPGVGRMAQIEDPTRAVFMLWQSMGHTGAAAEGIGACGWTELATKDRDKALAFYHAMFGWIRTEEGKPNKDGFEYAELGLEKGKPFMGLYQIGPEMGPMPSAWVNYFMVDDCDATAAKAQSLGGSLFVPPKDIPDVGRFCVIADPFGASFAAIKLLAR